MIVFPLDILPAARFRWWLEGASALGGQPMYGPAQAADLSCGGIWVCDLEMGNLYTADQVRTWRALLASVFSGTTPINVPIFDILQPSPETSGQAVSASYGSSTSYLEGSTFSAEASDLTLNAAAYMPAWPAPASPPTQLQIKSTSNAAFKAGHYVGLTNNTTGERRSHLIKSVLGVSGNVTTVSVMPPLRENYPVNTPVQVVRPAVTMKYDVRQKEQPWPMMEPPFKARPSIRFVEHFPDPS